MRGKFLASFNEAHGGAGGFNEARALCAGSLCSGRTRGHAQEASMRPAHYAREVYNQGDEGVDPRMLQ